MFYDIRQVDNSWMQLERISSAASFLRAVIKRDGIYRKITGDGKVRGMKDVYESSEARLENRKEEKVNFPLSFLTALSSYLSVSFRGFCPSRRWPTCARREMRNCAI